MILPSHGSQEPCIEPSSRLIQASVVAKNIISDCVSKQINNLQPGDVL